jgi:hypothetical protein
MSTDVIQKVLQTINPDKDALGDRRMMKDSP